MTDPVSRRSPMRRRLSCALSLALLCVGGAAAAQQPYRVIAHWPIGGDNRWDYVFIDPPRQRLYVSHGASVEVLDAKTGKVIATIGDLKGSHGIAVDGDGRFGYISDGAGGIVIFDTRTFAKVTAIATAQGPDGIIYEPVTKTVWTFNGRKGNAAATAVDTVTRELVATIPLTGERLESTTIDGKGHVFGNFGGMVARIDARTRQIDARWATGCADAAGIAYDRAGDRIFQACRGGRMFIVDARTGKLLGSSTIGDRPDGAGYSARSRQAFASTGDGFVTVVDAGKPGYPTAQKIATRIGARTMDYDPATDRIFTIGAERDPAVPIPGMPPAPSPGQPQGVPSAQPPGQAPGAMVGQTPPSPYKPGTFEVIVIGR